MTTEPGKLSYWEERFNKQVEVTIARIKERDKYHDECDSLRAERDRLREALKWYADAKHVVLHRDAVELHAQLATHEFVSSLLITEAETGAKARAALEAK